MKKRLIPAIGAITAALLISVAAEGQTGSSGPGTTEGPASTAPSGLTEPKPPPGPYKSALPHASSQMYEKGKTTNATKPKGTPGATGAATPDLAPPPAYGTNDAPYTTARAAVQTLGNSSTIADTPVTSYPYRAAGKLYFTEPGNGNFVCSASLIKPGVLVTASHCVNLFGAKKYYSNWTFCPANTSASGGVYGCYTASSPRVLTTYLDGSDICDQSGVICNDDIATLLVAPKNNTLAGNVVGWFGYAWNGYAYVSSPSLGGATVAQITQLGYPVAFDSGYKMQRNDAVGWYYFDSDNSLQNTQMGSAMTGGSSGGPWLVNFGTPPSVSSGASLGTQSGMHVIGVTSYDFTTVGVNQMGASYFGQNQQYEGTYGSYGVGNIGILVHDTCTAHPTYC